MPAKRSKVAFMTRDGPVSFKAKKRSPAKTLKELNKRLRKLKSPVMREMARDKWHAAHS